MLDSATQPTGRNAGAAPQRIVRVRRNYNRLVADETLEDFALRFTAKRSRRWTPFQLAMTACGGISFLALEALGGTLTLHYGFVHTLSATLAVAALIFAAGLPICYYAARFGVDLDLLTRGAGFGYLGSTVTSLIYAAFTFIFFAIEAAIMAVALEMMLGVPLWAGYVVCAVVVIPIVARGMTMISRFQIWTQPLWIVLNLAPFALLAVQGGLPMEEWVRFQGAHSRSGAGFDLVLFGAATTILGALVAQIGEQVDYLRFMPPRTPDNRFAWWAALVAGGPGWIVIGAAKIMAGSLLAVVALRAGFPPEDAEQPPTMYLVAFTQGLPTEALAILATGVFIVVAQMKINVTNAYAGSIAWSNFFSRLTHSHPGRVVWLVFNVAIALLLMEMGVLQALEEILGLYAILAVSWVFPLVADLVVNKPLGLSPPHIEFKRAHLYDINPVGFGAMAIGILSALATHVGLFGQTLSAFPAFVAIAASFCSSPLIAWATRGRYYIARQSHDVARGAPAIRCVVCDHTFEPEDMASCPAYSGFICSLCCSLEARCRDMCKRDSRVRQQVAGALHRRASPRLARFADSPRGHYVTIYLSLLALTGGILALIGFQTSLDRPADTPAITSVIARIFVVFAIVEGVAAWLFVLAYDSRRVAQEETRRQTDLLQAEIDAHGHTDLQLQREKERAETASRAKTRFLFGMSHELRTPLNSILGFAQILDADANLPEKRRTGVRVIRRSSEHLAGLIDGLLDISRIEAGKLQVYRDNIALGALLTEVSDMFRLQAEGAGIAFSFHADAMLPDHARGDEKRLRQVLINLLSNAVKFTTEGSVDFTVRYRSQIAEFRVADTGPGIAAADLERIFEPFERADAGGRIVPGTGLGLTITKLLVEIMGGDIRVSSEPGRGSTFVARVMLAAAAPPMGEADLGRLAGYAGRRRTVVVVDDEPAHRQLLTEFLQPIGFNVIEFESGPACLEAVSAAEPDLLILDVNMPGMDGWRLAGELRVRGVQAPVVMLSADRRPAVPDSRVCDDWVAKPVALPALLASVGRLLDLEWIHEGGSAAAPREDGELGRAEFPGEDDRRALADLAAIGFVKGLHAKLDEIAHREPRTRRFVARVRARLECFDLDGCMAILEGTGHDG